MIQKTTWQIECNHTPETIDRIMLPIRKRGLSVISLNYQQGKQPDLASCTLVFEIEEAESERIYKNMIRLQDILEIKKM